MRKATTTEQINSLTELALAAIKDGNLELAQMFQEQSQAIATDQK